MIREYLFDAWTTAITSVLGIVAPGYAAIYAKNRSLLKRTYAAAKSTGHNQLWRPQPTSAAREITGAWSTITARARDLERNNCYINGLRKKFVAGVVGTGMWPKAKCKKSDGTLDVLLNTDIENRYARWQETACANGDSFVDLQRQGVGHLLIDGEFLVRRVRIPGQPFALQLLEGDMLDSSRDTTSLPGGGRIVSGVELDKFDKPVAYWLYQAHPSDITTASERIDASEILHVFVRERASQVRGVCHFASIISEIFDTLEYQDATLVLARVSTAFGIFVQSPTPQDWLPGSTANTDAGGTPEKYMSPGSINTLLPGETIAQVKPENPGQVYDPYVRSRLRGASTGCGVSYETFSNDYSQANYSSTRQAMIMERALFRFISEIVDAKLNHKIYRWFMDNETRLASVDVKPLRLLDYATNPRKYWDVTFSRPRQEWIDPLKESKAAETRLAIGLDTLTRLAENEGEDIDNLMLTRAAEVARMKELGIWNIDPTPTTTISDSTATTTSTSVALATDNPDDLDNVDGNDGTV